jgi:hypothetical protein
MGNASPTFLPHSSVCVRTRFVLILNADACPSGSSLLISFPSIGYLISNSQRSPLWIRAIPSNMNISMPREFPFRLSCQIKPYMLLYCSPYHYVTGTGTQEDNPFTSSMGPFSVASTEAASNYDFLALAAPWFLIKCWKMRGARGGDNRWR